MTTKKADTVEQQIAKRLRQWREHDCYTRTAVALKIGISSDRLVSYENGRASLPWAVFRKIWEAFDLSPDFLMKGDAVPLEFPFDWAKDWVPNAPVETRFTDFFEAHLAPFFSELADVGLEENIKILEEFVQLAREKKVPAAAVGKLSRDSLKLFPRPLKIRIGRAIKLGEVPGALTRGEINDRKAAAEAAQEGKIR